ncbi:MAG: recombination mediator RecR [Proteobacteria bacterium]|nr:recombination mediator RecR [Pseudomonadota bacterium]
MSKFLLPDSIFKLMNELTKFPGVGEKTALRMILFGLRNNLTFFKDLGEAFINVYQNLKICKRCFNIAEDELCEICKDPKREEGILCVVEDIGDLMSIERTGQFKGRYHVLGGLVSPMENKRVEDLKIKELKNSVLLYKITEIILALNPSMEAEVTAFYIKDFLKDTGVKITKIAYGIPMGSDIEYLDEVTMAVAIKERREIE